MAVNRMHNLGSYWKRKRDQRLCRVVGVSPSFGSRPGAILELVYAPDYLPSILPSTIFESDFLEDYEYVTDCEQPTAEHEAADSGPVIERQNSAAKEENQESKTREEASDE